MPDRFGMASALSPDCPKTGVTAAAVSASTKGTFHHREAIVFSLVVSIPLDAFA
jgi:hypothetical protein